MTARGDSLHGFHSMRKQGCAVLMAGFVMLLTNAAQSDEIINTLPPTPLVLKDGRIARVSLHKVDFEAGSSDLAAMTEKQLMAFTHRMATDCFLTAQVIGHVDRKEASKRKTLESHRLARSRADTVQATLVAEGLPVASIASVWDWQFMVPQSQATIWVFRLASDEDCHDEALSKGQELVAERSKPAPPPQAPLPQKRPLLVSPLTTIVAAIAPGPKTHQKKTLSAATEGTIVTKPLPVPTPRASKPSPARPAIANDQIVANLEQSAQRADETAVLPKKGPQSSLKAGIDFSTNSSFFPSETPQQLRAFLGQLTPSSAHTLIVRAGLSGIEDVSGTTSEEEAKRYNRWLAERRLERVVGWLNTTRGDLDLKIDAAIAKEHQSRSVTIERSQ